MKRLLLFLCLVSIICFSGCQKRDNISNISSEQKISDEQEQKAIQEELDALNNRPLFNVSVDKMSETLEKDESLRLKKDKNLCIFENKAFEIQIGKWETDISEIYYTIHNKSPLEDEKLYDDFYKSIEIIFSQLGQILDKDKIDNEFKKITKKDQVLEFEYSDNIKLFIGKMKNDFDFRIYPIS